MRIENSLSPPVVGYILFNSRQDFSDSLWVGSSVSSVAANPLTVNQIRQQPSAKSDTRLLFYSADLQHVVRHGSHGIHPIPIPISPHSLYLMPPSATQSYQSCHSAVTEPPRSHHGAATEPPQSCHGSHGIIPSHPHLPTLALPNATFGYSKSSDLSRSCHRATTERPWIPRHHPISSTSPHSRSTECHLRLLKVISAVTEPPRSGHRAATGIR